MITPVILCGGSGTRLWPLSRKSYPKQFVPLMGERTLFQASALRLAGKADGLAFAPPVVLTNSDFRFIVTEQLAGVGIDPGAILIEPEGRNTGPAVLAAALHIAQTDPDAVMLVAPSDHVVTDLDAYHAAIAQGMSAVAEGKLVTFGIAPTHPEAAYGYLELAAPPDGTGAPAPLARFVEKPDAARAAEMLAAGTYLWNAGIFLAKVNDIIAAFEAHAPDLIAPVRAAVAAAESDLGFLRLAPGPWAETETETENTSVAYAVIGLPRDKPSCKQVLDARDEQGESVSVNGMVEKAPADEAPSILAVIDRCILAPVIMRNLSRIKTGSGKEIRPATEIDERRDVSGYRLRDQRFHSGPKVGFLQATVAFGLARDDLREKSGNYLLDLMSMGQAALYGGLSQPQRPNRYSLMRRGATAPFSAL